MATAYSRREILRLTAASAAAAALAGISVAEEKKRKMPIGLEPYSVRNERARTYEPIIEQVGKMGYEVVEFAGYYGWDKKPAALRKLLDDNGLKCCGTHTALATLEGDNLKKTAELHQALGNKFLICPSLRASDAQGWMDLAKKFNDISARAKEIGMLAGYHSHGGDFKKVDGKA